MVKWNSNRNKRQQRGYHIHQVITAKKLHIKRRWQAHDQCTVQIVRNFGMCSLEWEKNIPNSYHVARCGQRLQSCEYGIQVTKNKIVAKNHLLQGMSWTECTRNGHRHNKRWKKIKEEWNRWRKYLLVKCEKRKSIWNRLNVIFNWRPSTKILANVWFNSKAIATPNGIR